MDLGSVDRITADAVGEPGLRVFYLQAQVGTDTITVIVEKQQVQLLATSVMELLADLELETEETPDEDLSLHELDAEIRRLSTAARDGRAAGTALASGTPFHRL